MTKIFEGIIGWSALNSGGSDLMKLDPFDGASWKQKLSEPAADGTVTVTLSTGKTVIVNSRLLALLRLLADELAREETKLH